MRPTRASSRTNIARRSPKCWRKRARRTRRPAADPRRPARASQRAPRPFARGDAVPAAYLSRRDLVRWPSISTRFGSRKSCRKPTRRSRSASKSRPSFASAFAFGPGQHLTLRATIDGEEVRRNYSLCTAPDERRLDGHRQAHRRRAFSNWVGDELKAGDTIDVMAPHGSSRPIRAGEQAALRRDCRRVWDHAVMSLIRTAFRNEPTAASPCSTATATAIR